MMYNLLLVVEIIVSILLIGIVLIQRTKGQGAGLSFGSGAEAIFGAQMGNVLTRTTAILGIIFLINTIVLATIPAPTKENIENIYNQLLEDNSQIPSTSSDNMVVETPVAPEAETPAVPAAETPAALEAETPAAPAAETPVAPEAETPAAPEAETPVAPEAETPAAPAAETPAAPAPVEK